MSIIMEYAANGNLQDVLRKQRNTFDMNDLNRETDGSDNRRVSLTARDLIIFALHVASGMDYIESNEVSVRCQFTVGGEMGQTEGPSAHWWVGFSPLTLG